MNSIKSFEVAREVKGYYQIPAGGLATAVGVPGAGSKIIMQAEAQSVRYRLDGVNPTTTVGFLLAAGASVELTLPDNGTADIRVIAATAGAILNVHVFK